MTLGMARKMNHPETSPVCQLHAVMKRLIDVDKPVTKHPTSKGLKHPANAADAAVSEGPIDMSLLCWMGQHRGARAVLHVEKVAGVIDVSVGEEYRLDIFPT